MLIAVMLIAASGRAAVAANVAVYALSNCNFLPSDESTARHVARNALASK